MSRQVQLRRGTAVQHTTFTGLVGELTMNTTNNSLRLHDNVTVGGHEMLKSNLSNVLISSNGTFSLLDNLGGQTVRITNVADPVDDQDVATKKWVLDNGIGATSLDQLTDVVITDVVSGEFLKYDGANFINTTLSSADLTDGGDFATTTMLSDLQDELDTTQLNLGLNIDGTRPVYSSNNYILNTDTHHSALGKLDDALLTANNILDGLPEFGTSATYDAGTGANEVLLITEAGKLPILDGTNLTGVVLTTDYEDQDVLDKILNVDGTGSGLDADLLDGFHSTDFIPVTSLDTTAGNVQGAIPTLDENGHIKSNQLPDLAITSVSSGLLADRPLPDVDNIGDVYVTTDTFQTFISTGTEWLEILNPNATQIADLQTELDTTQSSLGLDTDGTRPVYSSNNYILNIDSHHSALGKLDAALNNTDTIISGYGTSVDYDAGVNANEVLLLDNTGAISSAILNLATTIGGVNIGDILTTSTDINALIDINTLKGDLNLSLNDLTDVSAPTPNTNDVLLYDGEGWVNSVIDIAIISGTGTSVTYDAGTAANEVLLLDNTGAISSTVLNLATTIGGVNIGDILTTSTDINALIDINTLKGDLDLASTDLTDSNNLPRLDALTNTFTGEIASDVLTITTSSSLAEATATTPDANDDSTRVATTEWVVDYVATNGGGGGATTLDQLTDVDAPTPNTNDVLLYSGTEWINSVIDIAIISGTGTSVTYDAGTAANEVLLLDNTGAISSTILNLATTIGGVNIGDILTINDDITSLVNVNDLNISINDLTDVDITGIQNNQTLVWNNNQFVPANTNLNIEIDNQGRVIESFDCGYVTDLIVGSTMDWQDADGNGGTPLNAEDLFLPISYFSNEDYGPLIG
ncbi:hypothetical protein EB001_16740 [bacterium]|nr:hypothetical protein [bacterium]